MSEDRYAARAARLLKQARSRIAPQRTAPPDEAIAALADTIRRVGVRRRRRRGLLVGAAASGLAAAAAVLVLRGGAPVPVAQVAGVPAPVAPPVSAPADRGFVFGRPDGASLTRPGQAPRALAAGEAWRAGDRLRAAGGPLALTPGDGTSLAVASGSELHLLRADAERWLRLASGAVSVHVSKLKAGERFVLVTPDAEVEVRGTRFKVDVVPAAAECGGGTVTRVAVEEGLVEVRTATGDARVPAGAHWPAGCEGDAPPPARAPHARMHAVAARASRVTSAAPRSAESTLATENDLFASALRAERDGDPREAVELLDLLLKRFPRSPLHGSAAAARERLASSSPPP
ncbi:MAG TPA: FecR family protein [Polyangia bacterium]|nr:FecR family protein [Polyangia bacterium]